VGFGEDNKDKVQEVEFDMIHVTPPQSAPDFVRNSNLGITKLITHH
jgi:sulfide:quinone oxidoreductase